MKQRDPTSFSAKEKYLLKRHRQDVARFERIHGPVSVLLGGSSLEELQSADVVGLDVRPSKSANCRLDKRKEGGVPAAEALRASVGAADGSKTPPKKVPGVRGSKKPSAASLKGSQSGTFKRIGSGGGQASSLKEPKSSASMDATGTDPSGITSGSRKETIKRARSGDDQPHSSTKKLKKSLSLEGHLQAAVIDRNDPDGKISTDLWQLVESRLLDEIAAHSGSPDDVSIKGADWAKGVKIVNCGNKNSFEFLRATVAKLGDLGQDTRLEVIQSSELPLRSIVTVWIPPPVRPVETILAVLAKQNGSLLTDQWKYVTSMVCKENTGRDFRFAVDGKSLEFLDRVKGVANFGLGTVRFRYSKQNRSKEAAGGADKPASL